MKKKQKKGKTAARSSRRVSRKTGVQASPQVLQITSGIRAARSELQAYTRRSEGPLSAAAARCQELYVIHTSDSAGRIQLDRERLAEALAEVGMGSLAEQALYSLALMAADDGHPVLFEADVLAVLERSATATTVARKAS
jgi:hypothetical protein